MPNQNTQKRERRDISRYDYLMVLQDEARYGNNRYVVKGYDTYPSHSVLAGQTRISFIDSFDTLEEAQEMYPEAELSHPFLEPRNTFHHLPGEDL